MKNLFIEGNPGSGKTSLLLKILGEDIQRAGGFATIRLSDRQSNLAGFRVVAASEMSCPDEEYQEGAPNIFLQFTPNTKIRDEQTFVSFAAKMLTDCSEAPFIVMDEFGGVELTDAVFTEKIKAVIASDKPVIGVLKSRRNALTMIRNVDPGEGYLEAYDSLREFIGHTDSVIVDMQETGTDGVSALIREWKKENL